MLRRSGNPDTSTSILGSELAFPVAVAPWAFRLTVFGTIFGLDVLWPARGQRRLRVQAPHAFLSRRVGDAPVRSYGRLHLGDTGVVQFAYRPWLVLSERRLELPAGSVTLAKGLLFPSVHHCPAAPAREVMLLALLPRYRSHEHTIAEHFGFKEVVESPLARGWQAILGWFRQALGWVRTRVA
jgi:hypothetical protein